MKKSFGLILAAFCVLLGMSATSLAQDGSTNDKPRTINERRKNQQKRIWDGVKDDELTRKEFARLEREQNQVRRQERRFRSDGVFTRVERARVQHNLNQSSRHIRRAKHN